jgi:hypothetical protein
VALAFILMDFFLFQKFLESLPCTERLRASSRDGSLSGADGKSGTNRSHPFPILEDSVGDLGLQDPHVFGPPGPNPLVRCTNPTPDPDPSFFSHKGSERIKNNFAKIRV